MEEINVLQKEFSDTFEYEKKSDGTYIIKKVKDTKIKQVTIPNSNKYW